MPLFVYAYTAPDGNVYTYKVNANTGSQTNKSYTIYSNNKMCTVDNQSYYGGKYILGIFNNQQDGQTVCTMLHMSGTTVTTPGTTKYPNDTTVNSSLDHGYRDFFENTTTPSYGAYNLTDYNCTNDEFNLPNFETLEQAYSYLTAPPIDFDELYYDPTIPTPEFIVQMERPTPWQDVTEDTNFFNITFNEYGGYYVQIGYKFSYPNGMKVGLVDGQVTYTPITYANSVYFDVYSLEDMKDASNINGFVTAYTFEPQSLPIQDAESWQTTVPIWANNFNNAKYVNARNNWNTKMRYCWPLYGNKLEIFERLFYVEDGACYVGAWKHWNNTYPSEYQEEIPNNYQVGNAIPYYY